VADFLSFMDQIPVGFLYVGLGIGAAVENVIPAVPADTFVALGGFLSAFGPLDSRLIFAVTWSLNVGSALVMYRVGYTHGRPFFMQGWGQRVLKNHQMDRMTRFYERWGTWAIFWTRFLPGLRAVVPIFAGITQQRFGPVAVPLAAASAIWYGTLIWLGALTGYNLEVLSALLTRTSSVLAVVTVLALLPVIYWLWRTKNDEPDE
jgi:membrane protein DedA with SNARE-associated domain